MPALDLVWICAAGTCGVTGATAFALVARRLLYDGAMRRAARLRVATIALLLAPAPARLSQKKQFTRNAAIEGLLHVLTLLRGREQERVVQAARELGAEEALCRTLRVGSPRRRMIAAEALGFFRGHRSLATLSRALSDTDCRVQAAAMKSLVVIDCRAWLAQLLRVLRSNDASRQSALSGILREAAARHPDVVTRALEEETHPRTQILLIDAVAAARFVGAAAALRRLANEGELNVRAAAIQTLWLVEGTPPPPAHDAKTRLAAA